MPNANALVSLINFNTSEWQVLKRWLEEEREDTVRALINAKTHDESMSYRGAINKLDKLLGAERAAKAAQ